MRKIVPIGKQWLAKQKKAKKKKAVTKKKPLKKKVKKVTVKPILTMEKKPDSALFPPDELQLWLQSNVDLINITGWERKSALPRTTLRQISAGKRKLTKQQLRLVTEKILPELKIIVEILGSYDRKMFSILKSVIPINNVN